MATCCNAAGALSATAAKSVMAFSKCWGAILAMSESVVATCCNAAGAMVFIVAKSGATWPRSWGYCATRVLCTWMMLAGGLVAVGMLLAIVACICCVCGMLRNCSAVGFCCTVVFCKTTVFSARGELVCACGVRKVAVSDFGVLRVVFRVAISLALW